MWREGVSWASSQVRRSENGDKLFLLVGTCGAHFKPCCRWGWGWGWTLIFPMMINHTDDNSSIKYNAVKSWHKSQNHEEQNSDEDLIFNQEGHLVFHPLIPHSIDTVSTHENNPKANSWEPQRSFRHHLVGWYQYSQFKTSPSVRVFPFYRPFSWF